MTARNQTVDFELLEAYSVAIDRMAQASEDVETVTLHHQPAALARYHKAWEAMTRARRALEASGYLAMCSGPNPLRAGKHQPNAYRATSPVRETSA